jgi:hypothetical protein
MRHAESKITMAQYTLASDDAIESGKLVADQLGSATRPARMRSSFISASARLGSR